MPRHINGNLVISISVHQMNEDLKYNRTYSKYLTETRTPKFVHLAERLISLSPELTELFAFIKGISLNWYKTLRGRIIGDYLRRYMIFQMHSAAYSHRADLLLYANYSIIKSFLQRIVKVLIKNYNFTDKYYSLKIPPKKLYALSQVFADEMEQASLDMVVHFEKLKAKDLAKKAQQFTR